MNKIESNRIELEFELEFEFELEHVIHSNWGRAPPSDQWSLVDAALN